MIVQWTEYDAFGYHIASETYPEANPKDFEREFRGKVLDKYQTFWGTPKFVVALQNGEIKTVRMSACKIVEE